MKNVLPLLRKENTKMWVESVEVNKKRSGFVGNLNVNLDIFFNAVGIKSNS